MKPRLKTGILGAGRIAQGFDKPGDKRVLTLAHAVARCRGLALAGFYDEQPGRAEAAEHKWHCPASPRDREAWLDAGWDVVCIATPDAAHPADLAAVLDRKPKAVLVEKPLAEDGAVARKLLQRARRLGIPLLVDFPRRWHSGIRAVTHLCHAGKLGRVRRITGTFSGGLHHNGVHLLDLVAQWCAPIRSVRVRLRRDKCAWLALRTAQGDVDLLLTEAVQDCFMWDVRVDTEHARIELCGVPERLSIQSKGPHPHFPGFTVLAVEQSWPMDEEPLLQRALEHLAGLAGKPDAIRAHLDLEIERQRFFHQVFRCCET